MLLKLTPDIARFYLLWAAFVLALPGALSLYSRYKGQVLVALPLMDTQPVLMMRVDRSSALPKVGLVMNKSAPLLLRSIIYVEHHDGWGAKGLILNKPLPEEAIKNMLPEWQGFDWRIGGTASFPRSAFVLVDKNKRTQDFFASGLQIMSLYEYTRAFPEKWRAVLSDPEKRQSFKIYLGYMSWRTLQLDREFRFGQWGNTDFSSMMLSPETDPQKLWRRALREFLKKTPPQDSKI